MDCLTVWHLMFHSYKHIHFPKSAIFFFHKIDFCIFFLTCSLWSEYAWMCICSNACTWNTRSVSLFPSSFFYLHIGTSFQPSFILCAHLYICSYRHMHMKNLYFLNEAGLFSLSMPLNTEKQDNFYKLLQVRIFWLFYSWFCRWMDKAAGNLYWATW